MDLQTIQNSVARKVVIPYGGEHTNGLSEVLSKQNILKMPRPIVVVESQEAEFPGPPRMFLEWLYGIWSAA